MIELVGIERSFTTASGFLPVLQGISLSIAEGEFVALTGPSGSGKSTLLSIIGCLDRPTAGKYSFDGVEVSGLSDEKESALRNTAIGFVFQAFHLIQSLTVLENAEVPLFYASIARSERRELAAEALKRVGLEDRLDHRPPELSGGEQQRAAIARALVRNPRVILADEPTGNLDTKTGAKIISIFEELSAEGKTLIVVTHDPGIAGHAPREIQLRDGIIEGDTNGPKNGSR